MHGALRSLIIPCVLGAIALGGASSLRAQDSQVSQVSQVSQDSQVSQVNQISQVAEPAAQAQEQPAQGQIAEPSVQAQPPAQAVPAQAKEQEKRQDQAATQTEAAPQQAAPQAPAPKEQQVSHAAPEQPAQQTPEPAATVDLSSYAPGTIVVETSERKLHLVLGNGEVLTYPVGVGKRGKSWAGTGAISGKYLRPAWSPPRALKREKPGTPDYIPGGSPRNPMGAAAMTLSVDQYAIHGTNNDSSIGGFVSFGCIRMHNRDILDLYKRVHVGTRVVVLR
jgi:lipoprotein-anchoring transpeptidase ErfK/SrfK